jgi:transposase
MMNKRPKPKEIVSKLRQVEVLMGQGMARLDAIRQIGVVEQTYYRWRKQYGGMRFLTSVLKISTHETRHTG